MDFGLFYFANDNCALDTARYDLLLSGARFADEHDFSAVWTPERHFHPFGGIYPNPAVTGAAVAAVTERVAIRAGSVVAPLHHPLRIAEEWSVVDNISGGRAGISLASGWHATDYVLRPENYPDRRKLVIDYAEQLRGLWRGDSMSAVDGVGNTSEVRIFPPPVQRELPIWITSAGGVDTFRAAGRIGAGLLTHLLGQDLDELANKIAEYRAAAAEHGSPGHVVLMVHTFLGDDEDQVRETVREPLSNYLRGSINLLLGSQLPGAKKIDPAKLRDSEIDFLVSRSFDRYYEDGGLLGTVPKALRVVDRARDLGVDELACLIDFGVDPKHVLAGLHHLNELRLLAKKA
ncbi:MupA/Atu3671 family FMN-dependent luciferase-like monooxygenase [Actinokineospora enzanensis]|uniref:MupA/Atu3671 family FMN-dependent luciferase-like monooxygenase n=1 Tax=Actinokineospora enzanensis TaxID=155975 RepID=UPI00037A797F|nr:MupA/Atu3671 family FMN-dependent luciferase-like monooxygenase [Actinokineospora enzanensis]